MTAASKRSTRAEPPPGPDAEPDARVLRGLDRLAWVLDSCVRVPFTRIRIGLDGLVGLVPVIGDAASAALALYPIVAAWRLGVPVTTLLVMLWHVVVDTTIGAIPVLGDLFDFGYKANRRNVDLLRARLRNRADAPGARD